MTSPLANLREALELLDIGPCTHAEAIEAIKAAELRIRDTIAALEQPAESAEAFDHSMSVNRERG